MGNVHYVGTLTNGQQVLKTEKVLVSTVVPTYGSSYVSLNNDMFYFMEDSGSLEDTLEYGKWYQLMFNVGITGSGYIKNDQFNVVSYFYAGDSKTLVGSYTNTTDHAFQTCVVDFQWYGQDIGFLFDYTLLGDTQSNNTSGLSAVSLIAQVTCQYSSMYTGIAVYEIPESEVYKTQDTLENIDRTTEQTKEIAEKTQETMDEVNETSKGIWGTIKDFFGGFFDNLIDSVLGLFVPSESDMQELLSQFNHFFEETFGFLYYPFSLITGFFNIFFGTGKGTSLELPSFSIMGYQVWDSLTFDITSVPVVNDVFSYVRIATGGILAMLFINYLRNFFDKRFGGGGS